MPRCITEFAESFIVTASDGTTVAAVYFDDGDEVRRRVTKRMAKADARVEAEAIARGSSLLELLKHRAEQLAGCTETSPEELELGLIADLINLYEGA